MTDLKRPPESEIRPKETLDAFLRGGVASATIKGGPVIAAGGGRVILELPIPSKEVQQNSRCHWSKKAKAVAEQRATACRAALAARIAGDILTPWRAAKADVQFTFADKRRRDPHNYSAALKGVWDGLTDSGLLVDDDQLAVNVEPNQIGERARCVVTLYDRTKS